MKFKDSCSDCFLGLACQNRIDIISLLKEKKQLSVSEIAKHFKVRQPTITHHLQYLKTIDLLSSQKRGKQVFYSLNRKCKGCGIFL